MCGQNLDKNMFYKDRTRPDGLCGKCKKCDLIDLHQRRNKNINPKEIQKTMSQLISAKQLADKYAVTEKVLLECLEAASV